MASDYRHAPPPTEPPDDFIEQVKQALEHLYDFPYLQQHPLAQSGGPVTAGPGEPAGQRLRRELTAAIEALSPGPDIPFRSPPARLHNLLHLQYVEGMTVHETAHELGISPRQAYRGLRQAVRSVAAFLWARHAGSLAPRPGVAQLSSVQAEMARLEDCQRPIDLHSLLQRARNAVARLAQERGIDLQVEVSSDPLIVSANPAMAQQVLVSTLSHAIQQARPGALRLAVSAAGERTAVTLSYLPQTSAGPASAVNPVAAQLANRLGWVVREEESLGEQCGVSLLISTGGPTVLVIDDNRELVELLDRYLSAYACRVVAATSGHEGLRLAEQVAPSAIVLDVMMPGADGWEVLQTLRTLPETTHIPIIVCSVFNDPELAHSLGASRFLAKPVSQDQILDILHDLRIV